MRVLFLTRYSRMGASSRLRTLQYLPLLGQFGIEVVHQALLPDQYLGELYRTGDRNFVTLAQAYARRRAALADLRGFDAVWVEKEIYPYLPSSAERALRKRGIPFIVDYDDATFHTYDLHRNPLVRQLLGHKIDKVMRIANCVVAGNRYLADRAAKAGAANIRMVPTVLDPGRYSTQRQPREPGTVTVGWIGSPSTTQYVKSILPAIAEAARQDARIRFTMVGGGTLKEPPMPVRFESWSEASEADSLTGFDIGIMPLFDTPWEQGKCGYKLIQYMAAGMPVVASPIGANLDIVDEGINGLFASSPSEWSNAILRLAESAELRQSYGHAGRQKVEEKYSINVMVRVVADIIRECAGDKK